MSHTPTDEKATRKQSLENVETVMKGTVGDYSGAVEKTDPVEIRLVRKLDMRIMPILWIMYFLNYVDRNAIAQARLNNLEEDLGLVGTQYNTAISVLFVGYLLMQIPSNMFITRTRPSIYMSACMIVWAVASGCTALVHDYTGLVLVRFFLGVAEAPYYPGALYLLASFYTRKEIATRVSILYSGNILATAFSGLIAAGIFDGLDGVKGLAGWRWLFIIEAALTVLVAFLGLVMLPDLPLTTRWLTPEERTLAHERIQRDTVGSDEGKSSALDGLKQAAGDYRTWVFCLMQNMHLSACSFNNFFPTVVGTLGFNRTITLVLTCPPYLVSGAVGVLVGYTSGRFNERTWHITISMGAALVGFVISTATLNTPVRYIACFLFASGAYAVNGVILGWVSATLSQSTEKKASALSIVNVLANASYIYTAYLWPKSDGPRYLTANASNAAFAFACIVCAWAMRGILKKQNAKMRQEENENVTFYAY